MLDDRRTTLADGAGVRELVELLRAALRTTDAWGPSGGRVLVPVSPAPGAASTSAGHLSQHSAGHSAKPGDGRLCQASHQETASPRARAGTRSADGIGGHAPADAAKARIVALVELAQRGDAEAFGQLYDHYVPSVYRYVYYRVGTHALAEDITSETFLRALRSLGSFRWQGRDFGAWLVTIARNLVTDHFKSGRFRLEVATGEILDSDSVTAGPEDDVLTRLTNEALVEALRRLGPDQQECLVMRFLNGMSVAETAQSLGKSEGAVKQLQLRAVRNLAKLLPDGLR
ncbi:RNA polymerase sigma-70 factor, ECF subfamily [Actinopolymorpha cephalotaxi]|uniref:RNA polymerase sigma-70 factor (ECF subfamily) n=1 Tax=Actinopolymorpha cephalotaxi TaxID=504797 RepID=A0A1I2NJR5_9ACTN|nr:sigma-70 family RNA polymerase sigma factor [Actinopolymorpha cephalotaxi]NYH85518.1 RNA polymerase sigma-70 factor (ECF subfamily) [Actinopolymorpha cephalotaxi]SFG03049.1 RNA polymerase sigma-70 factor, ECF subfamily [Actinopolymorpha cephalotaxi]